MIKLKKIKQKDLKVIWLKAYQEDMPKWATLNAPYFEEYQKYEDFETFFKEESKFFVRDSVRGIYLDGEIIGAVSYYYESKKTRWLEAGILIFEEENWGKGFGFEALTLWFDKIFKLEKDIVRIGMTSWSGNEGLMKLAIKLGMKEEGRLRKVRYFKGTYYDSMKYGILKEEWEHKKKA